ncbi:MAG: YfhO family protein [Patescibacteria group bacterium]
MKDLKKKSSVLFKKYWALPSIVLIVAVFFWKFFVKGLIPIPADIVVGAYFPWLDYKWGYEVRVPVKNPVTSDVVSFFYPMQITAIEMLKKGEIPLWNPYILAGTPLLANFQSAPFSPTNIFYFIFDKVSAWSLQIIMQHFLAALFTFFLLRHWKASRLGSVVGGIVFAFSGFNLIWSQWNGHALVAAFIPLLVLLTDRWLLFGKILDGLAVSVSFALLLFSGYPQLAIYLFIALALVWAIRVKEAKRLIPKTLLLGIFLLLGVGLAGAQILPGQELLSLSQRQVEPHPFDWAFLPWSKVITFFAPDYFGNHATKNYWGPQDYTSNTGFVGVVAFSLAFTSILLIRKKREVLFGFVLLVVSLFMSLPTPIPIFLWKSGFLGFNAASAHRILVLFNLAVALLAGFGVDIFLKKKVGLTKSVFIPGVVLFGFLGFSLYLYYLTKTAPARELFIHSQIPKYLISLRNLIFPMAILTGASLIFFLQSRMRQKARKILLIGLLILGLFELFRFGWKYTPFSPRHIIFPTTPVLDFLLSQEKPVRVTGKAIPINLKMAYGLEAMEGYDAVYPLRAAKLLSAMNYPKGGAPLGRFGAVDNVTSPILDLINTRYWIALRDEGEGRFSPKGEIPDYFDDPRFKIVFEDKTTVVLESRTSLPRAFMFYDWEVVENEDELLKKLVSDGFPFEKKLLLEKEPGIAKTQGKVISKVEYLEYQENKNTIEVETDKDGILFVSDTHFPGWQAFVDGHEADILRADYNFRGIPLSKGNHIVEMIYKPKSFYDGVKISLVSLFLLFLAIPFVKYLKLEK